MLLCMDRMVLVVYGVRLCVHACMCPGALMFIVYQHGETIYIHWQFTNSRVLRPDSVCVFVWASVSVCGWVHSIRIHVAWYSSTRKCIAYRFNPESARSEGNKSSNGAERRRRSSISWSETGGKETAKQEAQTPTNDSPQLQQYKIIGLKL